MNWRCDLFRKLDNSITFLLFYFILSFHPLHILIAGIILTDGCNCGGFIGGQYTATQRTVSRINTLTILLEHKILCVIHVIIHGVKL